MEYRYKLVETWKLTGEEKPFLEWLIDESERNHKKQVQMSGDLGEAFSRIGELESKLKSMVSSFNVSEILLWIVKNSQHQVQSILRSKDEAREILKHHQIEHPDEYFYIESEEV